MANPHKGEVAFEAGGRNYTLRFSADALCQLEDALGRGLIDILNEIAGWFDAPEKIRFSFIRQVFWAGLRDAHPDIDVKQAGELLLAAGGAIAGLGMINKGLAQAFPTPETKGARPPTAPAAATHGTGPNT